MKRYRYHYQSIIRFNTQVTRHYFKLRCMPGEQPFQHVLSEHLHLFPRVKVEYDSDTFGNRIQYGQTMELHDMFIFTASGTVEQSHYLIPDEHPHPMYLLESKFTKASAEMEDFLRQLGLDAEESVERKAVILANAVYEHMVYTPGSTDNDTTAQQAFATQQGVCQDYTHIYLSLCRLLGIPARYTNGFMTGIGVTHAWAEVYNGEAWIGIDPTNNNRIDYGYIKIAHGRDAADCPVNRGIIIGNALQTSEIRVLTEEIK